MTRKRKTKGDSEIERKKQAESELVESRILERVWQGPMQLQNRITWTKERDSITKSMQASEPKFTRIHRPSDKKKED